MKRVILIMLIAVAGVSCKKETPADIDYLSFGTAYGFCSGNCARFFKMEGDKIYPDSSNRFTGQGSIVYSATPLSNDKFLLAKELKDNFPAYLSGHADQTFGCPDCADQGGIHIEVKKNGVSKFWHIDTDINKQPAEIRPYIEKMLLILSQL